MNRIFLTIALAASVAVGCDTADTTGPATFTSDDLSIVGTDECGFFTANESYEAVITVVGSTVTMVVESIDNPGPQLEVTTDSYDPMQNEVLLTGLTVNTNNDPCLVELDDAFTLTLADRDLSLEEQDSLEVDWIHAEKETSTAWTEACTREENGDLRVDGDDNPITLWFNELPCSGEANLTMTLQQSQ